MTLDEWIAALHAKVMPPGRSSPERSVLFLRPRLDDLPEDWFTEEAINAVFLKLRSLNSAERVRKALRDFHAVQQGPQVRRAFGPTPEEEARAWQERQVELRDDWDDPAGILRFVNRYRTDHWALRRLCFLVVKWAPQHLGLLPPEIISAVAQNSSLVAGMLRRMDLPLAPERDRDEMLDGLGTDPWQGDRPAYLTPAQLDVVNPLPNGRRRTESAS
jgi:hypothetical protein